MQKESDSLNTPAMKQFAEIKRNYPEGILFFRMGDFYEMFLDDAILASKILDIALTKRQNSIPMCGIPYHSTDNYISRLISAGQKVVICEQKKSENPNIKIMTREVVRVITPGTLVEENLLNSFENNFFSIIEFENQKVKMAFADVSTSDLFFLEVNFDDKEKIFTNLKKFAPREIILVKEEEFYWAGLELESFGLLTIINRSEFQYEETIKFSKLRSILQFVVVKNFQSDRFSFKDAKILEESEYLEIDEDTVRNLDLIENQNSNSKNHSLFTVLNFCKTSSGKRFLKTRILFPYINENSIRDTWNKIGKLDLNKKHRYSIEKNLSEFGDIERIISRFRAGKGMPRDFKTIQKTISIANEILFSLKDINYEFRIQIDKLMQVQIFIAERISEKELPIVLSSEGEFIRTGFSEKLDRSREAKTKGKDWIIALEEKEKKSLGLNTFKIRFNKVVGYYIELSRKEAEFAPKHYFKKQTLVTSERFTFPELEEIERAILEADEVISEIEKTEFENMVIAVLTEYSSFYSLAREVGELDFIHSLLLAKNEFNWHRPEINLNGTINLFESRHPVIEKFLKFGERFVSNSIELDKGKNSIAILTGPNMAGKSTFMRQVAICQILFQIGSFIPAKNSSLCIVDKIFTRIGSGDDITTGQSTFYVEMKETSNILKTCTENSLILFDEIGRGTSTYDGMSIAWAILEYLASKKVKTKTIFATHYHELTTLEKIEGVFNLYLDTLEENGAILFLKKVKRGIAKKSFGIYVAKLAGIPNEIIENATNLLRNLESKKKEVKIQSDSQMILPLIMAEKSSSDSLSLALEKIDINKITPLEALHTLANLKKISGNHNG
jgi:DNA mismatch repair protein MutS